MNNSKRNIIITIASIVALAIIIGTYSMYADKLFQDSYETLIPYVQSRRHSQRATKSWSFFTKASIFSLENGPILIILANQKDRAIAFYFVTVYVFQVFFVGILELLLHRPAPFWVDADVRTFSCKPGYAAPAEAT